MKMEGYWGRLNVTQRDKQSEAIITCVATIKKIADFFFFFLK